MVVEVFKRFFDSNFLIENKFQQTILHMFLRLGTTTRYFLFPMEHIAAIPLSWDQSAAKYQELLVI
jgi:hypothetical protein